MKGAPNPSHIPLLQPHPVTPHTNPRIREREKVFTKAGLGKGKREKTGGKHPPPLLVKVKSPATPPIPQTPKPRTPHIPRGPNPPEEKAEGTQEPTTKIPHISCSRRPKTEGLSRWQKPERTSRLNTIQRTRKWDYRCRPKSKRLRRLIMSHRTSPRD